MWTRLWWQRNPHPLERHTPGMEPEWERGARSHQPLREAPHRWRSQNRSTAGKVVVLPGGSQYLACSPSSGAARCFLCQHLGRISLRDQRSSGCEVRNRVYLESTVSTYRLFNYF